MKPAPLSGERPVDLHLERAPDADWHRADAPPADSLSRASSLPVHPDTAACVHARLLSTHAVVAVVRGSGEIRIPYCRRSEKGDFALFMDALVTELGERPVRFTNVFMSDDGAAEAYDRLNRYLDRVAPGMTDIDRDDTVRLEDALDGFDYEIEDWAGEPVDTLVGQWDPHRERNSDHAEDED